MRIQSVDKVIRTTGKNQGKPYFKVTMEGGLKFLCDDDITHLKGREVAYGAKKVGETVWISNVRERSDVPDSVHTEKSDAHRGTASSFACSYAKDLVNTLMNGMFQHVSPMEYDLIKKSLFELRPVVADEISYYAELFEDKMGGK